MIVIKYTPKSESGLVVEEDNKSPVLYPISKVIEIGEYLSSISGLTFNKDKYYFVIIVNEDRSKFIYLLKKNVYTQSTSGFMLGNGSAQIFWDILECSTTKSARKS